MPYINRVRSSRVAQTLLLLLCASLSLSPLSAQTYLKGQNLEPAYEGWQQNEDGTYSFIFGYHNENWSEELNIPVGGKQLLQPGAGGSWPAHPFSAASQPFYIQGTGTCGLG